MNILNDLGIFLNGREIFFLINSSIDKTILTQNGNWYRGQSNFKYSPVPSIFRQGEKFDDIQYSEKNMFREFLGLRECQDKKDFSTFEWLSLAQHYNIPTRLLDWTENLFIALYFCLDEANIDGALFLMDPILLNKRSEITNKSFIYDYLNTHVIIRSNLSRINELREIFNLEEIKKIMQDHDLKYKIENGFIKIKGPSYSQEFRDDNWFFRTIKNPIAVRPMQQNERLFFQKGMFTLHGGKMLNGIEIIESKKIEDLLGDDLIKIKIPNISKASLRAELERIGINESTIFPELEHQCNAIKK